MNPTRQPTALAVFRSPALARCRQQGRQAVAVFQQVLLPANQIHIAQQHLDLAPDQQGLECRVVDSTLVPRYGFFVLEVLEAWRDPTLEDHPTLHHRGHGAFMLAGETIHLPSKMK